MHTQNVIFVLLKEVDDTEDTGETSARLSRLSTACVTLADTRQEIWLFHGSFKEGNPSLTTVNDPAEFPTEEC